MKMPAPGSAEDRQMALRVARLQVNGLMTMRGDWTPKGQRALARVEIEYAERGDGAVLTFDEIAVILFKETA